MAKPLYVLGAGGHAAVLVDILKGNSEKIDGIFSPSPDKSRKVLADIKNLKDEEILFDENKAEILLINGIGSLPGNMLRLMIYKKFVERGYEFKQVISKHAIISPHAVLGHGVQVMPGAIIQAGAIIGDNTIINTNAIIEHDCIIGNHNHIAPSATLSGEVNTGDCVHIGTGAAIIQGITIGNNTVIAAGAIITMNITNKKVAFGARANIQDKKG